MASSIASSPTVSACLLASHAACRLQVAERSLFLWNNEYIVQLVAQHRETVLPLVIGALEHNAKHHWNPAVHRCAGRTFPEKYLKYLI